MPQLTFQDSIRYFFSSFVFYFYYCLYDVKEAAEIQQQLSLLGIVSALVFGCLVYFIYRYFIYDSIILWLYDYIKMIIIGFLLETDTI